MSKKTINTEVAIIGAGLSALTIAYYLKKDFFIFEKDHEVGGLCKSKQAGDFIFDCDGHLLHFRRKNTKTFVEKMLNAELIHHKRSSWIYSKGTYTRYPFQANTFGLPHDIIMECLLELIEARKKNNSMEAVDFENWLINTFGKGYSRHFLIPYNRKFWKYPLKKITCEWMDGFIPVPTLEDSLEGALDDSKKLFGYNAHFWYPKRGGIGALPNNIYNNLPSEQILLGKSVKKVDLKASALILEDDTKVKYKYLINTIPMPELIKIASPHPKRILAETKKLKYTSIFNLNFGLKKPNTTKKHWIYFPEGDFPFFRLGVMSNFSPHVAPKGTSSVYLEFSYRGSNRMSIKKMFEHGRLGLRRLGLIDDFNDILVEDHNDIKYGYIIYDEHHRNVTDALKNYFSANNVFSVGRYGSWKYLSMEDVIIEGKSTAEGLNAK